MRAASAGRSRAASSTGRRCATTCWPRSSGSRASTPTSSTATTSRSSRSARRSTGPNQVTLADGTKLSAATILIATGAHPVVPDVPGAEHGITSNEMFHLDKMPKRAVIAGGGYIANEFAGILHEFACEVTIVNRGDLILRHYDEQVRDRLLQISLTKGINFKFNAPFEKIVKRKDGSLRIHLAGREPDRRRPAALGGRPLSQYERAGPRGGRRRARQERRDPGRRGQSVLGAEHLRDRRRHRPRPADPGRDPRGPGLRRHRVRRQADPGRLCQHPPRGVQPPADRLGRHDRRARRATSSAPTRPTSPISGR